jgi:serine protease DegS
VVPSGPADEAGLETGDVLLELDGRPILDARIAMSDIAAIEPGQSLPVTVLRNGESREMIVEVGERPPPELRQVER